MHVPALPPSFVSSSIGSLLPQLAASPGPERIAGLGHEMHGCGRGANEVKTLTTLEAPSMKECLKRRFC